MTGRIEQIARRSLLQARQIKQYCNLRRSQWLDPARLAIVQEKKLKCIVRHAYRNVKYYHHLFKSLNLKPNDVRKVDDLSRIPTLTKSVVQNNSEELVANKIDRNSCFICKTSGSTGRPLTTILDQSGYVDVGSRLYRTYLEGGVKLRDRIAHFSDPHHFFRSRQWFNRLGFFVRANLSVFDDIEEHISKLLRLSPDVLDGYPSILLLIAETIQDKNISGIHPRLIFCTAELLGEDARERINSAFGVELFDRYGSAEFGNFAWECQEHNGYHIDSESVIVEFLRNGEAVSPGDRGEVVVTGLFNYAMPLLRYSLGDIGGLNVGACSCGRGLPLMKIVDGRADDFLVLPSGRTVSPRSINLLEYVGGILRYRVIQKSMDRLLVQIEKGRNFSERAIAQVKSEIRKGCLGEDVEINVDLVDEIPRDRSGKIRTVISEVKKMPK